MSFKRIIIIVLLVVLIFLEASDFMGNVSTAFSAENFAAAQQSFGISRIHQALRLSFLLPASALITLFAIFVFLGILFNSSLLRFTRMLVTVLVLMAIFHIIHSGFVLRSPFGGIGFIFLAFAFLIGWLVPSSMSEES